MFLFAAFATAGTMIHEPAAEAAAATRILQVSFVKLRSLGSSIDETKMAKSRRSLVNRLMAPPAAMEMTALTISPPLRDRTRRRKLRAVATAYETMSVSCTSKLFSVKSAENEMSSKAALSVLSHTMNPNIATLAHTRPYVAVQPSITLSISQNRKKPQLPTQPLTSHARFRGSRLLILNFCPFVLNFSVTSHARSHSWSPLILNCSV
mmetsp:Transcript_1512/g.4496  ORF Transcript_1512/g.4496 Transcript_1512/m.4496 type:complete len:208 (-) Transcript_1512:136-759(-)